MTKWTSVDDKRPGFGKAVLLAGPDGPDDYFVTVGYWRGIDGWVEESWTRGAQPFKVSTVITHWMPLPAPPQVRQ